MKEVYGRNESVDNKYKLPNVSNYIKDERLLNSINDCKLNAFITLTNKNKINNISFEDYPNFFSIWYSKIWEV